MNSFNIGDLNIPVPIIQGGMGIGISLSGLASAEANKGGVGVIITVGIGLIDDNKITDYRKNNIDLLRKVILKAREQALGVLGVNIMSVITDFSDMVRTSIEEGIDIIFSGAGLPLDLLKYLGKGIKTKLVPIISSARVASILCYKWKNNFNYLRDALVIEGPKAGVHLGFKSKDLLDDSMNLENLVSNVWEVTREIKIKYNKDIPLIAAGRIFSGYDMLHIMKQGASANQLGSRFVATEECDASSVKCKNVFIGANTEKIHQISAVNEVFDETINEFQQTQHNN
ncbi:NAD(P)H-dependent flavin oxidoreductase [Bacteroidota bacterium]